MSSDPLIIADTVALSLSILLCLGALYRSLSVRRVLVAPAYRSRALWTGLVGAFIMGFDVLQIVSENIYPTAPLSGTLPEGVALWFVIGFAIVSFSGVIILYFWLDSTIQVALDLDFLHRDAVEWKKLRRYAVIAAVLLAIVSGLTIYAWEYEIVGALLGVLLLYMGAVLTVAARRVREGTMRRYMKWMGLLVIAVIVEITASTINFYLNFPLAVFALFLYKAATSLARNTEISTNSLQE